MRMQVGKRLRATILSVLFMALLSAIKPVSATAQTDHATFGVQAGYTSKNESVVMGVFFQYRVADILRLSPEVGCVFRRHDLDAFTFDLNAHFPFDFGTSRACLYPLAGINYSSWSLHNIDLGPDKDKDVSTRVSKFGLNAGAGFEYLVSPTLKLKAEWKYTITSKYSTRVMSVGVGYMF